MQARDATGRQVSLLNDDIYASHPSYPSPPHYASSGGDRSPLSHTPELLRSDSYDSNASYDHYSPMTPSVQEYVSRPFYDEYIQDKQLALPRRPAYASTMRTESYDDDSSNNSNEKPGKRYPCRYRDTHGCEKTFTTSGHASRHSKIHTAEKAVQCTFAGCHKKFTRADNMKQHLETHFKDKSRSSTSSKSKSSSMSSTKPGSVSSKSSSSRPSRDVHMWDVDDYDVQSPDETWDMCGLNAPLVMRSSAARTSSGLDALAAIACQEA